MNEHRPDPTAVPEATSDAKPAAPALPPYEPPRLVKKRSVARATLVTGTGPLAGGLMAQG